MNIKRVKSAFLFPNGILAVCDIKGEQIHELQGAYSIDKHKRIYLESLPDCEFKGFDILPQSFLEAVTQWYLHFEKQNLSCQGVFEQITYAQSLVKKRL